MIRKEKHLKRKRTLETEREVVEAEDIETGKKKFQSEEP